MKNLGHRVCKFMTYLFAGLFIFLAACSICQAKQKLSSYTEVTAFIQKMVTKYNFNEYYIKRLFDKATLSAKVIRNMESPYEDKPWDVYRAHFVDSFRINGGINYWHRHANALHYAAEKYGVPEQIIVAIIGIESVYGRERCRYRVIDSLLTLSFAYPKRMAYFRNELEKYLLLTRELNTDPALIYGSYAGAIGLPQFMPSSYRNFAVPYGMRHAPNLVGDTDDVVVSVANYLQQNGWQQGEPVAVRAKILGNKYQQVLSNSLKPKFTIAELRKYKVYPAHGKILGSMPAGLIALQNSHGANEYWLIFNNFHALAKYNSSKQYVMAAYLLGNEIRKKMVTE